MTADNFSTLQLPDTLLSNLPSLGYTTMTPIQAQSLPPILAGKDVIAQGKTGSGKTAAFGLGLLAKLDTNSFAVQSLVLCPTRELADQVANEIRRLARGMQNIKVLTLCGGAPFGRQADSLGYGAHIIVGTPGRILDHLTRETLHFRKLTTLVLDEADRMLEMGFQEALDTIIEQTPTARQTLMFSATFPSHVEKIARRILREPEKVQVESTHDSSSIQQHFYQVEGEKHRLTAVQLLLLHHRPESAVIFCNTKIEVQQVADSLRARGFSALALHGDFEQRDRDQTLVRFSNKSASVLVATDVAARGLDIDSLDAVINYHVGRDPDTHLHRIGRTGRADSKGAAYTLFGEKEAHKAEMLQHYLGQPVISEPLPSAELLKQTPTKSGMVTLQIDGGKKQKVRPGDILGALTGGKGIAGAQVGKINLFDNWAFVAVSRTVADAALKKLAEGKMKGRSFRVRLLQGYPEQAPKDERYRRRR